MTTNDIEELDSCTLVQDQGNGVFEVEFVDKEGKTKAIKTIKILPEDTITGNFVWESIGRRIYDNK